MPTNGYIEWGSFEGPDQPSQFADAQAVLDAGAYRLMDAATAVDELVALATKYPQVRDFHYWAQLPGESIESGSERIQYIADKVIPEVSRRLAEGGGHAHGSSSRLTPSGRPAPSAPSPTAVRKCRRVRRRSANP